MDMDTLVVEHEAAVRQRARLREAELARRLGALEHQAWRQARRQASRGRLRAAVGLLGAALVAAALLLGGAAGLVS